jgi:hypothetical protein
MTHRSQRLRMGEALGDLIDPGPKDEHHQIAEPVRRPMIKGEAAPLFQWLL